MPTYQYACNDCGHDFEAVQSFSDDALTTCPECGGSLRKLFGNVGVVFKGSGFYRTDSRKDSGSAGSSTAASSTDSATAAPTSTASTPTASTPTTSTSSTNTASSST